MAEFEVGLYETLVTEGFRQELGEYLENQVSITPISDGDVADRISRHVGAILERVLSDLPDEDRIQRSIDISNVLLAKIGEFSDQTSNDLLEDPGGVLRAIMPLRPDGKPHQYLEPLVPLLDTALLTNAPGEPALWNQLLAEIDSSDGIDVVMAFIRRSGIRPLIPSLRRHCESGKRLRVLTTTYTNSTERSALDQLAELGAEIKISYDLSSTRLHAKAWCFHRRSGFTTAYVGSSNLTFSAQVTGLEWNLRIAAPRNPDVVDKFIAVFESYWQNKDFVPYDPQQFDEEAARQGLYEDRIVILPGVELRPEPFQERLLELITLARQQGHHRNLLVAATGTGKTVMAAVDYARLRDVIPRARLLFVAHREEILDQSIATFRYALRDSSFGEKWVGKSRPSEFQHVFASIQMLNAIDISLIPADHFDVVVVDEFHHAAATSYVRLLNHVKPRELLGLTATPERNDGLTIFSWFDNRIAAELRLWDAIDQGRLSPFIYYGVHDGLDLSKIPWRRGHGYDVDALSQLYTSSDAWARLVVHQLTEHAENMATMRCLGFCVSVEHARFMAHHFNENGIPAVVVWGSSSDIDRRAALLQLSNGDVKIIFSVDLFNEGVDIPKVDTILMLRPTESATLFMQQLGRGLRRSSGKTVCTVLDFVGTHRSEFRYDKRFRALLGGSRKDVERAVKLGFPYLPAGCHMQLDRKAADIVLNSLKSALPSRWPAKVEELRALGQSGKSISLSIFLDETGLDLLDVYDGQTGHNWSALCEQAGITTLARGNNEDKLRSAVGRMLHIDDAERLVGYREFLESDVPPSYSILTVRRRRLLRMLVTSLLGRILPSGTSVEEGVQVLWTHPQIRSELCGLLEELVRRQSHVNQVLNGSLDVPLQIHARYTRLEILAAMGEGEQALVGVPEWREGVRQAKTEGAELLVITLDKSVSSFSPTTRYKDYAISPTLIHWESQSKTAAESPTALRYRNHEREGRSVLLFSRLQTNDRAFWFLGPAKYRGHVGEKPMSITWELEHPLAGDLFVEFAAAVA